MVSVIVPVFNAEKTLSECIHSILRQTYGCFELIIIDDGSTDRSGQICDEMQLICINKNIRCQVIHQKNGGVSAARNYGVQIANGEFFVFIDSDDTIEPCYLEDLIRTSEDHPEFGHVLCGFKCTSHKHNYVFSSDETISVLDRSDYMLLFDKVLIQGPCFALYKTDIVRKCGIRMREDLSRAEDILFNLRYLDSLDLTTIGVVNKTNYTYQNEDQNSLYRQYKPDLLALNDTVNQTIALYLRKWKVTDNESWDKYYNMVFWNYIAVLKNTIHEKNPVSKREQYAYNNAILKQELFRKALNNSTVVLSPALRRAYETGNYNRVRIVELVDSIKRSVLQFFKQKRYHGDSI